ncbi:pyruvate dehydrogenase E1 component subunit alpha [Amycolatopsis mediterranei S699]|uniref:Pyruvate dehydrogenase E1 component subunit alpha n=2 Tax=Amycolatopsis mediterranei TaxID=33910 RepID=A0A0H3DFQ4_AMYMU|nr:thiamine pyrophosphate-dependent enzyme [Amycolatopsis mediterranei]ADJ48943.1 pyruvate dehydrogenase E1 component subunit alpha [Amycolatopsis mediterranei U32]AEK45891.1 pyruvate dehydrogenase E1 component subunit alpha [Amycolatopsis mediterranei S699]AFO80651.1 pyruvate dehydrogenase E1 component subunit alpha [Amycolatopsis mediterranei S699]AGT87779.1 pyruvate dehydrogenase E1 component subunit alpha [Amycolatopsis mediterranei RB]KDU93937.1 pyruvate dehydrogenase [Amycolatopsis medit
MDFAHVDGNDVVGEIVTDLVAKLRTGGGPVLLEAETYRWHGHFEGESAGLP